MFTCCWLKRARKCQSITALDLMGHTVYSLPGLSVVMLVYLVIPVMGLVGAGKMLSVACHLAEVMYMLISSKKALLQGHCMKK